MEAEHRRVVTAVLQVPMALEALVKGPWDTQGEVWRKQLDLAAQVGVCCTWVNV